MEIKGKTSISVLVILGLKYTLAASRTYCPLVSQVEYAPRALLRLEKKIGQTDGRQTDASRLPLDAASVIIKCVFSLSQTAVDPVWY